MQPRSDVEPRNAAGAPGGSGWGPGPGGPPAGGYGYPPPPAGGGWGAPPGAPPPGPPQAGWGAPPVAQAGWGQPVAAYGGGGGLAPPQVAELQSKVDRWFMLSIASLFFGCGILGIIPILKANGAKEAMQRQDYARAAADIGTAKLLCILGFIAFGGLALFYVIFFVALRLAFF